MSKVVKFSFDYMSLSDAVQALPWPGGYSPTLPTGPNVTPINTSGISVTDRYQTNVVAAAGLMYGVDTIGIPAATSAQMTVTLPFYSNVLIFNMSTSRLLWAPQSFVGTNIPAVAIRPGCISSWSWTMLNGLPPLTTTQAGTITTFSLSVTAQTAPTVAPATATQLATGNYANIIFWQDAPAND